MILAYNVSPEPDICIVFEGLNLTVMSELTTLRRQDSYFQMIDESHIVIPSNTCMTTDSVQQVFDLVHSKQLCIQTPQQMNICIDEALPTANYFLLQDEVDALQLEITRYVDTHCLAQTWRLCMRDRLHHSLFASNWHIWLLRCFHNWLQDNNLMQWQEFTHGCSNRDCLRTAYAVMHMMCIDLPYKPLNSLFVNEPNMIYRRMCTTFELYMKEDKTQLSQIELKHLLCNPDLFNTCNCCRQWRVLFCALMSYHVDIDCFLHHNVPVHKNHAHATKHQLKCAKFVNEIHVWRRMYQKPTLQSILHCC